jgi:Protein of unknown function (DUF1186)/SEC-C motif
MKSVHQSRSERSARYPIATLNAYGPDNTRATKLVVSVIKKPGRDPSAMETWTTEAGDIRDDPAIAAEVARFTRQHRAQQTVSTGLIIGCPHEEGIDYPLGRTCPRCPFWATIDRFTYEPLPVPVATMTADEVLAVLASDMPVVPPSVIESADAHRVALVEPLLSTIEHSLRDPAGASPAEATLFSYALYLLAKWREPRAYPYVVRWLSLPGEGPFEIAGDIVTQDGGRILAAVCDGDLEPIQALVLDRGADGASRAAGITALSLLAAWAEVPREPIVDWFLWLAQEGLEREPGQVWNGLAGASADMEALPLFPDLRRAFAEGLIETVFMHVKELDEIEAAPRGSVLEDYKERQYPIDNVWNATSWWRRSDRFDDDQVRTEPYRAPPKVGRNEPCPCGSGKKFKKCCGA